MDEGGCGGWVRWVKQRALDRACCSLLCLEWDRVTGELPFSACHSHSVAITSYTLMVPRAVLRMLHVNVYTAQIPR